LEAESKSFFNPSSVAAVAKFVPIFEAIAPEDFAHLVGSSDTGPPVERLGQEALQTGQGFVVKTDAEKELLAAIEAVIEGKRFVSHRLLNDGHAFDFERWQAAD
jgi:hypothetical protein